LIFAQKGSEDLKSAIKKQTDYKSLGRSNMAQVKNLRQWEEGINKLTDYKSARTRELIN